MEVKKECINFMEQCVKLSTNVCVEGDVIVPDVKPDIREILLADANGIARSWEYRNGKLIISGTVFLNILYRPDTEDGEGEIKSLNSSFDFSDSVDILSGEEIDFYVNAMTEHIGFNLVNSRKLSAKVIVSLEIRGNCSSVFEPITDILDENVPCKKQDYQMELPLPEACERFKVSDLLTIPADMPDIEEILKMDAWASGTSCKKMNGKGMIQGTLHVKTLYTAADDGYTACVVSHEIPFTEIVEADGLDEDCTVGMTFFVEDIMHSVRGDMNGDTKIIHADILVSVRLKAAKTGKLTIVDDCYGIHQGTKCIYDTISISEPGTREQTVFSQIQAVKMENREKLQEVVHVTCKPIVREVGFEEDGIYVRGTLVSFLLYREEKSDAPIRSKVTETDFVWKKPIEKKGNVIDCDLWIEDVRGAKKSSEEAEVVATLGLSIAVCNRRDVTVVTDCTLSSDEESEKPRPELVLYFAEDGDTLWGIAKRYGTTMEKIKVANNLEKNRFSGGEKLLIPRVG